MEGMRHMVTLFRLTWAVPDFILIMAATSNLLRWMCNQVKSAQSGHNVHVMLCLIKNHSQLMKGFFCDENDCI